MTTEPTTRVQRALKLEDVPSAKWHVMIQRTILGALFVALGLAGAIWWGWPALYVVGLTVFGASLWSTQLVTHAMMAMATPLRELRRAFKGNGNGNGSGDGGH